MIAGSAARRDAVAWAAGAAIAVFVNAVIIVALALASQLHRDEPRADLVVRRLRRETEPPATTPPARPPSQAPMTERPAAEPPPLPSLDLAPASAGAPALPDLASIEPTIDLPLAVPAFSAATDAAGLAGPAAVGAVEADQPAVLQTQFDLERYYPRAARVRGLTGHSRVQLDIDAQGRVTAVRVLDSQPSGVFDDATERLARDLRFTPAQHAGAPVASQDVLNIAWTLGRP